MLKNITLACVFIFTIFSQSKAQCPGALTCEASEVFCAIDALNGFRCTNPIFPNATFPLGSLCFGAGAPHNLSWWSFVGAGGALNLTFNFDPADCNTGQGIQAGVFEGDCAGTVQWACDAACNNSSFTFGGVTIACEIYYVWVDGCNGDYCDYEMLVMGNGGAPMLQRPIPPPTMTGQPCLCGEVEVCQPAIAGCTPVASWTVDGIPVGMDGDDCVTIVIDDLAPSIVCMTVTIGNPANPNAICDQDFSCITITPTPPEQRIGLLRRVCEKIDPFEWHGQVITTSCITPPCSARVQLANGCCVDSLVPIEIVPPLPYINPIPTVVCSEDQPVDWHGMVISSSCITPPCTARLEGPDGCLFDSIRVFDLLPVRNIGMRDTFLCGVGVILTEDGRQFTTDACEEEISFKDARYFCDTSYILNARFFKYSKMWEVECGDCTEPGVKLCPNIEYDPDCSLFDDGLVTIELEWVDIASGGVINRTDGLGCLTFTKPGAICVDIIATFQGKKCPVSGRECYNIEASWFPAAQPITGDSSVCGTVPGEYRVDSILKVCEYVWEIRSGGGVITTPSPSDTNGILVDWSNRTGSSGEVCVKILTSCGESPDTCFTVDFAGAPIISAGPDTNICAQAYTMTGFEDIGGMWTQTAGPAAATITDPNLITTNVNVGTYGEYKFIWAESENGCESVDTVTIGFRPDPTIENIDTICGGDATDFTVTFDLMTGTAPFTIISGGGSIIGSTYTSGVIPDNTPTTVVIRDAYGCETTFFIDYDCECPNSAGDIDQNALEFCGALEACAVYDNSGEMLDAGDISIFVLYTNLGQIATTQLATNTTGCFTFDPATMIWGQTYYIGVVVGQDDGMGGVDFAAGCVQVAEATPVTWYENPTPDAGLDNTVCGPVYDLTGLSSVTGSTYQWINVPGVSFGDGSQLNTTATIQLNGFGTYQMILEETNAICVSRDTVEITYFEEPEPLNTEEICLNFDTYEYIICFDIQKGTGPYIIIQGGGTIDPVTGRYCSDSLNSLEMYDIIIRDANGCEFTLTGTHNCDCGPTDPGTMPQNVIETCVDLCVDITTNGTEMLQADEEVEFILHEGSGTVIINEISRMAYDHQANPAEVVQFCFDAGVGMIAGRVYYVSRVVHEIGNALDECERISTGQPIIWNNYPSADAGMDEDVCGLSTTLNAAPSIGTGGWALTSSPAGSNAILVNSMPATMLTVDQYGSYTFQWKEDNVGCADSASVTINFHDAPVVSNIMFECDDVAENYRISFTISDGESSSITVNGMAAVSPYISGWIPTGTSINLGITDSWDCAPTQIDTMFDCMCITEPGTITGDDKLCLDECVQVTLNGGVADANDLIRYLLHDGDANTIGGTIIECNATGEFCFDQFAMTANTAYFITVLTGNDDGNGCVNQTDRCLGQSLGIEVTWYEYPTPVIQSNNNTFTCDTDSLILDGFSSVTPSGQFNYLWSTGDGVICASSNTSGSQINICASGTYYLTIIDPVSGCQTIDSVFIDKDINTPTVIPGNTSVLTCDVTSVTLDATGSDFGGDFMLEWLDPLGNVIGSGITTMVTTPGTYTVRVRNTVTNCDDEKTVIITEDVTPPTAVIDQVGQLNCTTEKIELDGANSMTQGGIRNFVWSTTTGSITGSTTSTSIEVTEPGQYMLIIIDEQNGCADTNLVDVFEIGNTFVSLDVLAMDPLCFGENNGQIDANPVGIVGGQAPYEYSLNDGGYGSNNLFSNLSPGQYEVTVRDANGCEKDTIVTIGEPAEITITTKQDQFKEAGESIWIDSLIQEITGTDRFDADSLQWFDEDGNQITNLTIDSLKNTIRLTVRIYKNGCFDTDIINIFVKFTRNVFVPNIINVDGTGDNNKLYVYGNKDRIDQINFIRIYDRWGERLYNAENVAYDEALGRSEEGWDASFNGEAVNPGVFVYHIEVAFFGNDGEVYLQEFAGDVTVIK